MIAAPYLQAGDKVAVLSTARAISLSEIEPALKVFREWQLEPKLMPNIFAVNHQLAGRPEQRAADLQQAMDDPEITAIFCARGGYGTVQVLEHLRWDQLLKNPKWIVGYSDVTVLHSQLSKLGLASIHATMPINFPSNTRQSLESLQRALFGAELEIPFSPHPLQRNGEAHGLLTGGNISIIYSQCGSPAALDTRGKLLFLEDLDEYLYHIDRMMYNLRRNGYFDELAGLIIGGLSDMNDNATPFGESAEEIIKRHAAPYSFPVAFGFPAGHLDDNRALVMGASAGIKVSQNGGQLKFLNHGRTQ